MSNSRNQSGHRSVIRLSELDTGELVERATAGDEAAFRALVELTQADVYTLALRMSANPDDAHDIVQEAYVRAYRALKNFRGDAAFITWIYRITANTASTYLKRRYRRRFEPLPDGFEPIDLTVDNDPVVTAEFSDLRSRVDAAVRRLPPKLRAVVVLRDIYDLPHDAVAEELGISVSAAKVRLHRARAQLRADLSAPTGGEAREL